MLILPIRITTTTSGSPSGASGNITILKEVGGICRLIYVKPTTSTTQYDFKLTDKDNDTPYYVTDQVGTLRDNTPRLVKGTYTWAIENASVDEAFIIKLEVQEKA